ncbi:MAG: hypothetical protein KDH96_03335 [Candidatus Riesia sp.]|nr:hypothetical protein [Candidatus Riesia sp.]
MDYDYEYNCELEGCYEDYCCRCGQIVNASVTKVCIDKVVEDIANEYSPKLNPAQKYVLERLLVHTTNILDLADWDISVTNSYYGEEIDSVSFPSEAVGLTHRTVIPLDTYEKAVPFYLKAENSFELDILKGKKFKEIQVKSDQLVFGNKGHLESLTEGRLDLYEQRLQLGNVHGYTPTYPLGIVTQEGTKKDPKYRVWDGYHRLSAAKNLVRLDKYKSDSALKVKVLLAY